MRLREFQLFEYKRDKTAQNLGLKLINKLLKDRTFMRFNNLPWLKDHFNNMQTDDNDILSDPAKVSEVVDEALRKIEDVDPSNNKQYVQWLVLRYIDGSFRFFEDVLSGHVSELLTKFHELKQRRQLPAELADINRIKGGQIIMANFSMEINELHNNFQIAKGEKEAKTEMSKGEAEEVFKDEHVRVIVPEDKQAACYYGQGTQWCTAATQGMNYFDEYNKDGKMYILLPTKPQYKGEKYQLHFQSGQYMDETDSPVDLSEILDNRFHGSGLLEFFRTKEPTVNNLIQFAPEGLLMDIVQEISNYVNFDLVSEMVSSWEINDDYYYTWLRDEGYVTDDEVSDDAPSYADYNDEVGDFEATIENLVDLNKDELDDVSNTYSLEMERPTVIKDIADAIAWHLKNEARRYEFDAVIEDIAKDMEKHLVVKVQWGGDGQPSGFQLMYGWMTMEDRRNKWNERVYAEKSYA
jgi:hypothetical protein